MSWIAMATARCSGLAGVRILRSCWCLGEVPRSEAPEPVLVDFRYWNQPMKQTHQITRYFSTRFQPPRLAALPLVLLFCMAGVATDAGASDKKANREREALRRVQQQLSQVQEEKAAVEQEKSKLAADLEKAKASSKAVEGKVARLQSGLGSSKQQLAILTNDLSQVKVELARTAEQLSETKKTLAETTEALRQTEAAKRNLEAIRARNERDIASCERKNVALYGIGRSLMDRFEHKTCGEALAEREPFAGLKKVET